MKEEKKINKKHFNEIYYDLSDIDKEECYFCGFNYTVDRHHIIPKYMGGTDEPNNFIFLCPNHHKLIHLRKYFLRLVNGIYFLTDSSDINNNFHPYNYKEKRIREPPHLSIINAKEQGFIETKNNGMIKLTDKNVGFPSKWFKIKNSSKEVCNEKGVQTIKER